MVKNIAANAGDIRDVGLIPGSGRSPGGGHGNPLQYSCLENPKDRESWQDTVHWVTQSQTQLKQPNMHACTQCGITDIFNLTLEFGFLYKSSLFITLVFIFFYHTLVAFNFSRSIHVLFINLGLYLIC